MNDKLIRRAALKYRDWMISQATQPVYVNKISIRNALCRVVSKATQMQKWTERFFNGSTPRLQRSPWNERTHHGLISSDVYTGIASVLVPDIGGDAIAEIHRTIAMLKIAISPKITVQLSVKSAIDEVRAINTAWDEVQFRNNILSVLIEDVKLRDGYEQVDLGGFWIHLNINRPLGDTLIESVDCIVSKSGGYHPHVSSRKELCVGEGGNLMNDAICQGRLEDYFRIVEAILRTYNEASPYEPLSDWYNSDHEDEFYCDRCEEWRSDEASVYCGECSTQYCDHCDPGGGVCTGCDNWRCRKCSTQCNECKKTVCNSCSLSCNECNNTMCPSCRVSCVMCDNVCCSSCTQSCPQCGNIVCDSCQIDEKCPECEENICENCLTTCGECDRTMCGHCADNPCGHCGVATCKTCNDQHNCLLEGVTNG